MTWFDMYNLYMIYIRRSKLELPSKGYKDDYNLWLYKVNIDISMDVAELQVD